MSHLLFELVNVGLEKNGRTLLKNINLKIDQPEFIALLGHNGSGKSTLLKILTGQYILTSGSRYCSFRKHELSIMTQQPDDSLFPELTVRENIQLWIQRSINTKRLSVEDVLKKSPRGERLSEFLDTEVSQLSGGEKQLFLLGLILAVPPKILFLDENTSNLDIQAAQEVMNHSVELIKEYKIPTIMITHDLNAATQYADRFVVLKEGAILADFQNNNSITADEIKRIVFN
jgi:putative tryptophan/tyrosine transport system ATP-binding protein